MGNYSWLFLSPKAPKIKREASHLFLLLISSASLLPQASLFAIQAGADNETSNNQSTKNIPRGYRRYTPGTAEKGEKKDKKNTKITKTLP
jgi:hypothetical protein